MSSLYTVYKHTCPNGKVYIGITRQEPINRWRYGHGYHNNQYFARAIAKYGWSNIKHEILFEGLTKKEACEKEVELIAAYRSNEIEFGYNISAGGDGSESVSAATREKIRQTLTGHFVSSETRDKISRALTGGKASDETKRKLSEMRKGKCPNKGYKWTDEQRARQRELCIKTCTTSKRVMQIKCDEIVGTFSSITEASDATGINVQNISAVCRGKRKTAGGYAWEFEEK